MTEIPDQQTWYILGAGAIGTLWACYFRECGFPVTLLTRGKESRTSVKLLVENTSHCYRVDQVILDSDHLPSLKIRQLLVCTKAQDTPAALLAIQDHLAPGADVILLQNGICNPSASTLLPDQTVVTAITGDGAYIDSSGRVVHAGRGETWIGCDDNMLRKLPAAKLQIRCCEDIEFRQWKKLAINAAVNGLTAIHHCRNGELLANTQALQSIDLICDEVALLSTRLQIDLPAETLKASVRQTLQETANNYSSTYQDIAMQRPTEIACINGYLCDLAAHHGIDCPENRRIVQAIQQLESA